MSGFIFRTPRRIISAWQIDRDQVASYAERKGWTLAQAERWLAPNLGYDPDAGAAPGVRQSGGLTFAQGFAAVRICRARLA